MLIEEVDFKEISKYKNAKVIPAFMKYENEYYKIAYSQKYVERA